MRQHKGDNNKPKSHRQIDPPQTCGQYRGRKQANGQPCLGILGHRQTTIGQWQASQPIGDLCGLRAGHQHQQDITCANGGLADLFGDPFALARNAHQNRPLAPVQPNSLCGLADHSAGLGHHDLDHLQPGAIWGQIALTPGLGKIQGQGRAELIQRLWPGL